MLPLEGVRITDLSWLFAGPWGTRQLAAMGAEVIRIEWQANLDFLRTLQTIPVPGSNGSPEEHRKPKSLNRSAFYNNTNTGKLSITLNVKHARGKEIFTKLIAASDVVVENFSAGVLKSWGFSYPELRAVRDDIIYVQLPGFGNSGPYATYRAYGLINQAFSGLTYLSGLPEPEQPCGWAYGYMDSMIGLTNALAVVTALHHRNRTGEGQHIALAQTELGLYITGTPYLDRQVNNRAYQRTGNRSPYVPAAPHGAYRCAGIDNWVAIACFTEEEWQAFCHAIGDPDWTTDRRFATLSDRLQHQDALDECVESWTQYRGKHEIMHLLQKAGVPAGAVQTPEDLMEHDPVLTSRDYLAWLKQSEVGLWPVESPPMKLSRTPLDPGGPLHRASPSFGEDTEYVLKDILKYSSEEIAALRGEGCI